MATNHSTYLPQDILVKILQLLPFASILECKRVSKEWKSLINDPKFHNLYHDKSLTSFLSRGSLYCALVRHDANKLSVNSPCTVHRIPITFTPGTAENLVSEPSNAVACVRLIKNQFFVYNLFTGESYTVVDPLILNPPLFNIEYIHYGSGYDHYDGDYKIVVLCNNQNLHTQKWLDHVKKKRKMFDIEVVQKEENSQFWVYSFRDLAWKTLQGFPYDAYVWPYKGRACSFNGVLHWGFRKRKDQKDVIVTYDLHTSRFRELSEVPTDKDALCYNLTELGGQLCCSIRYDYRVHVWGMKEYGVKESWTKLFSIERSTLRINRVSMEEMALYESRDGRKIVLFVCSYKQRLIWYTIEHGTVVPLNTIDPLYLSL